MPRFWFQSTLEMDKAPEYERALVAHCAGVLDPGSEIDFVGVPPGTWGGGQAAQLLGNPLAFHQLLARPFIGNAMEAQRQGYDAYIIGTYVEPFLREARCAVDIPVISSFEATLLMACTLGHTIGIVTLNRDLVWIHKLNLEKHRLGARVGPILAIEPELPERALGRLLDDPGDYLDSFRTAARRAVDAGADVVIPAEGLIAILAARHGVLGIDGATILDGIAVPVCFAQMTAKLWSRAGLRTGRRWHYPSATGTPFDIVRSLLEASVPGPTTGASPV